MKKVFLPFAFVLTLLGVGLSSCDKIVDFIEDLLTEGDATEALKEALRVGSDTAVFQGSQLDGYFGNQLIKILMPQEADPIINAINLIPGGNLLVDEVVLKLNRAAEDAAPQASGILLQAITDITIVDAINIVNGPNDAATQYLRSATQDTINMLFRPHIESSLQAVGAQTAWGELTNVYNSLPLVTPVNTDLAGYTTDRASFGLFELVAIEEGKIRNDPIHRVTEILNQVFGDGN
jgi:hypothetical protein